MGSGTDPEDCRGRAEIAPGKWETCGRYAHWDGLHVVGDLTWPAAEGDVRRSDGLIFHSLQQDRILFALRELCEWDDYPGDTQELVADAKRRLRDAYKWLTRREPELGKGRRYR